ncbi:MAG: hypothetical protein CV087_23170 [Candidatus Brocadia sp. WS118]|nr:MAG: hypothetical protein CV087_23170 [Candidatus Brocadia sp. WS118]
MSEWKEITWGEIVTLEYGKGLTDYQNSSGKFPVFGTNGRIGFTDTYLCPYPGVIVGRKGAYRGVHYSDQPFFVIDTAFYLKPISENTIDLRYAYYKLLTQDINRLDSGSAIPSTSRDDFYRLELELPPFEEQKEIAAILSSLDQKISLLHRQNQTLEQIAQVLFKRWFVEFEFPNKNGQPYKSSGGKMVATELGDIPEGWRVSKLKEVCKVINGRAYKNDEFKMSGTPIVRIQNLTGKGSIVYSDLKLDEDKYINAGDLIYAWSATFGPYIWRGSKSIYHYHIWKLNCFNHQTKFYLYFYLKRISENVKNQGTGSIFTHITKELMEKQEMVYPSLPILELSYNIFNAVDNKIKVNIDQIKNLTKLRDALLPKLMRGQIRVKE